jgi:Zn-finger nucleic acid-binding protein
VPVAESHIVIKDKMICRGCDPWTALPDKISNEGERLMQCPIDGTQLVMTDRSGVEIDYCPQCRGVWLDRGELDKIIERGSLLSPREVSGLRDNDGDDSRHRDMRRDDQQGKPYKKKRREGFLGDLFDF